MCVSNLCHLIEAAGGTSEIRAFLPDGKVNVMDFAGIGRMEDADAHDKPGRPIVNRGLKGAARRQASS